MTSTDFIVRAANPTIEEGVCFAGYMNSAADGGFRKMFGNRFEEIISNAYLEPNHDLSYETAVFAEIEGQIVGMAAGFTAEQHRQFDKKMVNRFAGGSIVRISLIYAMIAPMMRFLHTYDEGDFYLQFLAVDEGMRGRGIGTALIVAMETQARESNAIGFAIDVSAKNANARRLYEQQGFVAQARWPKLKLLGPAIIRLVKPL